MIFKGEPNLYVRISNKMYQRITGVKGFIFDSNGRYETENANVCKILSQHFEAVEPTKEHIKQEIAEPIKEEIKDNVYKCKKCDFETDNKGELMAHYRKNHKKEE